MKNLKITLMIMTLAVLVFTACGGPKKCNGSRGTRTDMGTM
jgi:hypothetical protein